ncbi:MAG: hypothetical protein HY782_16210 [Chloroflexi bacterium]|nr:hypothetical protein [Chloroflexota bacterium]
MRTGNSDSETGQSLVVIALLMVAMFGMLGLALDGGAVFVARRNAQNAADAAALAGVRSLAYDDTESTISSYTSTYAMANQVVTNSDLTASFVNSNGNYVCRIGQNCNGVPSSATGVQVTTTIRVQPYFIDVLIGKQPIPIQAAAVAQSGSPAAAGHLMPVVLPWPCPGQPVSSRTCISYGTRYELQGGQTTSGGFQWLTFDCSTHVEDYLTLQKPSGTYLADPTRQYINTPDMSAPSAWVCGETGFRSSAAVTSALDWWLNPQIHPDGALWIIPVSDESVSQGNNAKYHIVSFALFQVMGYDFAGQSNPNNFSCSVSGSKCIEGKFLMTVENLSFTPGRCNRNGVNICAIGLSQ